MEHHFRISVEADQVERLLGELLVARSFCRDIHAEVMQIDIEAAEKSGDPYIITLGDGVPDPDLARRSFGPVTDQLEPLINSLTHRLTAAIDYLRVNPD